MLSSSSSSPSSSASSAQATPFSATYLVVKNDGAPFSSITTAKTAIYDPRINNSDYVVNYYIDNSGVPIAGGVLLKGIRKTEFGDSPKSPEDRIGFNVLPAAFIQLTDQDKKEIFKEVADTLDNQTKNQSVGSCLIVTVVEKIDENTVNIWTINSGDSSAHWVSANGQKVKKLNVDHDYKNGLEKERIIERIREKRGPAQEVLRSYGDREEQENGVISAPEITKHNVTKAQASGSLGHLVIASDGIRNYYGGLQKKGEKTIEIPEDEALNKNLASLVTSSPKESPASISHKLAHVAKENGSLDDISVIKVELDNLPIGSATIFLDADGHRGPAVATYLLANYPKELIEAVSKKIKPAVAASCEPSILIADTGNLKLPIFPSVDDYKNITLASEMPASPPPTNFFISLLVCFYNNLCHLFCCSFTSSAPASSCKNNPSVFFASGASTSSTLDKKSEIVEVLSTSTPSTINGEAKITEVFRVDLAYPLSPEKEVQLKEDYSFQTRSRCS